MLIRDSLEITLRQMDRWYQSVLGSHLLEIERAELDKYLPNYQGDHLLQIGGPSEAFLFENAAIQHKIRLSPERSPVFFGPSVCGDIYQLPFLSESIDVILLPHLLEFTHHSVDLLSECYRILLPEGRLLILSFNPCSLWGIRKSFDKKNILPWRSHFHMRAGVKRILLDQGFMIEHTATMLFEPPIRSKYWLKKLFSLEALGRVCWSDWGAVYIIIAHKRTVNPLLMPSIEGV